MDATDFALAVLLGCLLSSAAYLVWSIRQENRKLNQAFSDRIDKEWEEMNR